MKRLGLPIALVVASLAVSGSAFAGGKGKKHKDDTEEAGGAAAKGADADGVRRDPAGVKGISPFWEAIKKGDNAYGARDFDGAIAAYRDAITKEPQNAFGHYRMGEAQLAKGDSQEAEASWVSALRFASDASLKAKVLFVLADLRERQKSLDDATERWSAYDKHATEHNDAKAYPATPKERQRRITEWKKLVEDYGAVKARIEKRLREAGPPKP